MFGYGDANYSHENVINRSSSEPQDDSQAVNMLLTLLSPAPYVHKHTISDNNTEFCSVESNSINSMNSTKNEFEITSITPNDEIMNEYPMSLLMMSADSNDIDVIQPVPRRRRTLSALADIAEIIADSPIDSQETQENEDSNIQTIISASTGTSPTGSVGVRKTFSVDGKGSFKRLKLNLDKLKFSKLNENSHENQTSNLVSPGSEVVLSSDMIWSYDYDLLMSMKQEK